jgi:hypothetical protein
MLKWGVLASGAGAATLRAEQAGAAHAAAAHYIYDKIDKREGKIKDRWWDGERDMLGLIEAEKKDRRDIPELFRWAKP